MPSVPYEHIYPLIAQASQEGDAMRVTFRCPVTGATVEARGPLRRPTTVAAKVDKAARRRLAWSLRTAVSRVAYGAMGGGAAGSLAAGAASGALSSAAATQTYGDDDKKAAIVAAFESVAGEFVWDAHANRYISFQAAGEVMTEFMQQLNAAPVSTPGDRHVCARVLTEIACADGHLGEDERGFLAGFVTPDLGTIEALARRPSLTAAELADTSRSRARDTILMLAWSLALSDEEIAPEEEARLAELAAALAIDPQRSLQLAAFARAYIVDQALRLAYANGGPEPAAHAEALRLGERLGLTHAEIERADLRCRKRYGLT